MLNFLRNTYPVLEILKLIHHIAFGNKKLVNLLIHSLITKKESCKCYFKILSRSHNWVMFSVPQNQKNFQFYIKIFKNETNHDKPNKLTIIFKSNLVRLVMEQFLALFLPSQMLHLNFVLVLLSPACHIQ